MIVRGLKFQPMKGRELPVPCLAIRHFRYFHEGKYSKNFTDHKPLTLSFAKVSDLWLASQQRHLIYISEYTASVQHISGRSNKIVDAFSRIAINTIHALAQGIDYTALMAVQREDEEMFT